MAWDPDPSPDRSAYRRIVERAHRFHETARGSGRLKVTLSALLSILVVASLVWSQTNGPG